MRTLKSPLPVIDGVAASRLYLPQGRWKTILEFLNERHPRVGTATWISRMKKGHLVDESGNRLERDLAYCAGTSIYYYREINAEQTIPFEESILYQDEHLLVADKPHYLPVIPSGNFLHETLLVRLRKKTNLSALTPLHRIDRGTAGVVLFSCNPLTRGMYAALFNNRQVKKDYEALAPENAKLCFPLTRRSRIVAGEPFFRMRETEGEPNSETDIDLMDRLNGICRYRVVRLTGKKHQIRVHLAALGLGIINDNLYPEMCVEKEVYDFSRPLKLLAKSVAFKDPLNGQQRYFETNHKLVP